MFKKIDYLSSPSLCRTTFRHDYTEAWLTQVSVATYNGDIKWERNYNVKDNISLQYSASCTCSTGEVIYLSLSDDYVEGLKLFVTSHSPARAFYKITISENEYLDQLISIFDSIVGEKPKTSKAKTYDNISKLMIAKPSEEKVLNKRGIKAQKLLVDVEFQHNEQYLGEE